MKESSGIFELPVRSPLVDLAWMLSSLWAMASLTLLGCFLVVRIRNAGDLPFFTHSP